MVEQLKAIGWFLIAHTSEFPAELVMQVKVMEEFQGIIPKSKMSIIILQEEKVIPHNEYQQHLREADTSITKITPEKHQAIHIPYQTISRLGAIQVAHQDHIQIDLRTLEILQKAEVLLTIHFLHPQKAAPPLVEVVTPLVVVIGHQVTLQGVADQVEVVGGHQVPQEVEVDNSITFCLS